MRTNELLGAVKLQSKIPKLSLGIWLLRFAFELERILTG